MMADILSEETAVENMKLKDRDNEVFRELYNNNDSPASPEERKLRTTFSSEQVLLLEKRFNKQRYLSANERLELAKKLRLSDNQVKTWYQNRRMKLKRQLKLQMQRYHEQLYFESLQKCYLQTEHSMLLNSRNCIHEINSHHNFFSLPERNASRLPSPFPPKLERCECSHSLPTQ